MEDKATVDLFVCQGGKDSQSLSVGSPQEILDYHRLSQADFNLSMGNNSGVDMGYLSSIVMFNGHFSYVGLPDCMDPAR